MVKLQVISRYMLGERSSSRPAIVLHRGYAAVHISLGEHAQLRMGGGKVWSHINISVSVAPTDVWSEQRLQQSVSVLGDLSAPVVNLCIECLKHISACLARNHGLLESLEP